MTNLSVTCSNCGLAIYLPDDINQFTCGRCGALLLVEKGPGYITTRIISSTIEQFPLQPVAQSYTPISNPEPLPPVYAYTPLAKKNKRFGIYFVIFAIACLGIYALTLSPKSSSALKSPPSALPQTTVPTETPLPQPTFTPSVTSTNTITVTPTTAWQAEIKSEVSLRSGPGINYQVVRVAKVGETLTVYDRNEDGAWLRIDSEKQIWLPVSSISINVSVTTMPKASTMTLTPSYTPTVTKTFTPTWTTIPSRTPLPTQTLIPAIQLYDIYDNSKKMTELQFADYSTNIVGKLIREYIIIGNVDANGTVSLSGPWSPLIFNVSDFCAVMIGVPKTTAISWKGGEKYFVEASVYMIARDHSYYYNCEKTLVLSYVK